MTDMTRAEAIRELSYIADEMPSMECRDWKEALYMGIKQMDALDKIVTEIEENINYNKKMDYKGIMVGLLVALNIVKKYKSESEVKE